jgi:hypothetical protein
MKKAPGSVYDKWNISVVICDTYIGSENGRVVTIVLKVDISMEKITIKRK